MTQLDPVVPQVLAARSIAYAALSALFREEPTEATLANLSRREVLDAFRFICDGSDASQEFAAELERAARDIEGMGALRDQFTRLFIGPAKPKAPYWESVYLDPREILFTASTADVRRTYHAEGFELATGVHEAEDSLYLQLEFLAHTGQKALRLAQTQDGAELARLLQRQIAFIDTHMTNWVPAFCERVVSAKPSGQFWPTATLFVQHLLERDRQLLAEVAASC